MFDWICEMTSTELWLVVLLSQRPGEVAAGMLTRILGGFRHMHVEHRGAHLTGHT